MATLFARPTRKKPACAEVVAQSVAALDMAGNPCTTMSSRLSRAQADLLEAGPYFHTIMASGFLPGQAGEYRRGRENLVAQLQVSRSATAPSS